MEADSMDRRDLEDIPKCTEESFQQRLILTINYLEGSTMFVSHPRHVFVFNVLAIPFLDLFLFAAPILGSSALSCL